MAKVTIVLTDTTPDGKPTLSVQVEGDRTVPTPAVVLASLAVQELTPFVVPEKPNECDKDTEHSE